MTRCFYTGLLYFRGKEKTYNRISYYSSIAIKNYDLGYIQDVTERDNIFMKKLKFQGIGIRANTVVCSFIIR